MENFETLRKEWNSLEAGSGSGESSLAHPAAETFVMLTLGWSGQAGEEESPIFWLYPLGGENKPLTMRELLELASSEKIILYYNAFDSPEYPYYTSSIGFYTREDGSWSLWLVPSAGCVINGETLDDEIKGGYSA